jgi:hypothetical protein
MSRAAQPWRPYVQLLAQVIRDPAASGLMVRLTWFLGACGLGMLAFGWYVGKPALGHMLFVALLSGAAYLWCGAIMKSAVQQNHPAYAALVPQLRGRLMTLTAVLYATTTAVIAVMAAAVVGHPGYALVAGGLFSTFVLFAQRYTLLAFLPSALILWTVSMNNAPFKAVLAVATRIGEPLLTGVGLIVVVLLFGRGLQAAFPQAGDRHWAWRLRYSERQLALSGKRPATAGLSPTELRWQSLWRTGYVAALRRDSRGVATQGRMMTHALGPGAHEAGYIGFALTATVITTVAVRYYSGGKSGLVDALLSGSLMQWCVMLACLMYVIGVAGNVGRYSAEQRLYCLTPAAPAAAQLNRVLVAMLLRRFLNVWLVSLACVLCIDFAILGRLEVRGLTVGLAALMLPLSGAMLRNYAAMPARHSDLGPVIVTVLIVMICMMALILAHVQLDLPWYWIGGGLALATAIGLRWRWNRMMALPTVLPAGRLVA